MSKWFSKTENIFILFCIFWGLVFLAINPPFQASDETSHMYKMYGFTEGVFNFKKEHLSFQKGLYTGLYLPNNLFDISQYNSKLWGNSNEKTSLSTTKLLLKVPLKSDAMVFCAYSVPIYTPISYFPPLISLFVMKFFNVAPLVMMYVMRFCNLMAYLAMIYFAMKITPVKKWLFFAAAVVPQAIYFASAVNSDPIVTGFAFLTTAYAMHLAFDKEIEKLENKHFIIFATLSILLTICKFPYFVLSFLFLFIPKYKFNKLKTKYTTLCIMLVIELLITSIILGTFFIALSGITPVDQDINPMPLIKCLKVIFLTLVKYINLLYTNFITNGFYYLKGIFAFFGWSDTDVPPWVIYSYLFLIIICGVVNEDKEPKFEIALPGKLLLTAIFLLITIITTVACFISFGNQIGTEIFIPQGRFFQGRYWIPVLPVAMLIFNCKKIRFNLKWFKILTFLAFNFLMFICTIEILYRFYV